MYHRIFEQISLGVSEELGDTGPTAKVQLLSIDELQARGRVSHLHERAVLTHDRAFHIQFFVARFGFERRVSRHRRPSHNVSVEILTVGLIGKVDSLIACEDQLRRATADFLYHGTCTHVYLSLFYDLTFDLQL